MIVTHLYQSANESAVAVMVGRHSRVSRDSRLLKVSVIFIFSSRWNCSSLYVNTKENQIRVNLTAVRSTT